MVFVEASDDHQKTMLVNSHEDKHGSHHKGIDTPTKASNDKYLESPSSVATSSLLIVGEDSTASAANVSLSSATTPTGDDGGVDDGIPTKEETALRYPVGDSDGSVLNAPTARLWKGVTSDYVQCDATDGATALRKGEESQVVSRGIHSSSSPSSSFDQDINIYLESTTVTAAPGKGEESSSNCEHYLDMHQRHEEYSNDDVGDIDAPDSHENIKDDDKDEEQEDESMEWPSVMMDAELDKAVQTALQKTDSMSSSSPSLSSSNWVTDVHGDKGGQYDDDDDDDDDGDDDGDDDDSGSVFSSNSTTPSVNTIKSAVQLRLEQRQKPVSPTMTSLQAKLDAAEQRKLYFLEGIIHKSRGRLERISSAKSLMDDQHSVHVGTLRRSLDEKLASATERKDGQLRDRIAQLREKNVKALGTRSCIQEQSMHEAMILREKLDAKLQEATEKKEKSMVHFSEKMQAKMTRMTEAKISAKSAVEEMGKKLSEKLEAAASRSVEHYDRRKQKAARGGWVVESSAPVDDTDGEKVVDSNGGVYDDDDAVSLKKQELIDKLSLAAKRKEAILKQRTAKATAYLKAAYERGIEMKQKESVQQEDTQPPTCEILRANSSSLASIQEDKEYDPTDDYVALQWLHDENNSVASSISSGAMRSSKTKAQKRLESYVRMSPSLSQVNDKLDAASKRRATILDNTKDKADTQGKFVKISEKIQMAEAKVKELSKNLHEKMEIATQRKEAYVNHSRKSKAASTTSKLQRAHAKLAIKDAKMFEMQQRLESKLMMAYERKERIIAEKSARASSDVSSSTERAKIASHEREMMIHKVRLKSENRLGSASSRRKRLRDLEKQKQEVLMLRREIAKSSKADNKLKLVQKKLHDKMTSAHERKEMFLAAKKAKAAEHLLSSTDRGLEVLEMNEIKEEETKARVEQKLESAEKRRLALAQKDQEKRERQKARHQKALELAMQRRHERDAISSWEEVSLPTVVETEEFVGTPISVRSHSQQSFPPAFSPDEDLDNHENHDIHENDNKYIPNHDGNGNDDYDADASYEEQRLRAKQQLVEEIRLANMAKLKEMEQLTKQLKKPHFGRMHRDISVSAESFGTLDSNEVLSFDENEMDVSISGLSTILQHEKKTMENKKAQAALALAELDIKLSEIQLMQAILLAEEASLCGKAEFKTSDQSVEDLNRVQVHQDFFQKDRKQQSKSAPHQKERLKNRAKSFLSNTFQQAKVAKDKAGKTLLELKTKIELSELERKKKRKNGEAEK